MKGGKDEEKMMEPLFPRLHVNDQEKGGPRAPPRNKMALYEQLSVPSQRFNSAASSSTQGGFHERSVFSSFYIPPTTLAHSADKFHSHSTHGVNLNATREELERESTKNASYKMSKNVTGTSLPAAECSSFHPQDISNSKSSCDKKIGDEDDFMVPTYVHSGIPPYFSEDQHCVNREKLIPFHTTYPSGPSTVTATNSSPKSASAGCNHSIQHQNALGNSLERTNSTDLKSTQHGRNWNEKPKEAVTVKEHRAMSTGEHFSEPSKYTKTSSIQEHLSGSVDDHESLRNGNTQMGKKSSAGLMAEGGNYGAGISVEPRGLPGSRVSGNGSISRVWSEPCSRGPLENSHKIPIGCENGSEECEDTASGSLQLRDIDRNDDDGSETSMVDSISGTDISPDDVVGIIGQKHFWKARRAIVNQQRVFAVQVFELHRLIKVQKLIAGSPHLLVEDNHCFSRPPKVPSKELPSEYILKSQPKMAKRKDDSQKPCQSIECPAENEVGKAACPSLDDGISKGVVTIYGPYGNPSQPISMAPENKANPWCFQPAGNQWLVPVMSPSEGLVYKPYTGSCPPTAGFMAPVYGGFGPLCLPPATGDLMNMAYGVPAHQQQGIGVFSGTPSVAPSYFPHYGLPVMNPAISASAVKQVNQLSGARSRMQAERLPMGEVNSNMHSQSSRNVSNQKSEAFSCGVKKFQRSKDSELQGSTASSPFERVQSGTGHVTEGRDALTLFPMAQAEGLDQPPQALTNDRQTHVIKVVPHNPRSATESAARIFRSIQEERQQYD